MIKTKILFFSFLSNGFWKDAKWGLGQDKNRCLKSSFVYWEYGVNGEIGGLALTLPLAL